MSAAEHSVRDIPFGHNGYKFEMLGRGKGDDSFLSVVMGTRRDGDNTGTKHIVWTFNHQQSGFGDGLYTDNRDKAADEFLRRYKKYNGRLS